jgi:hypothetical protein
LRRGCVGSPERRLGGPLDRLRDRKAWRGPRGTTPDVGRERAASLMRRKDGPAIRDTLIWFAALIASGALGVYFWGRWAAVPFFIVYGVLYGSSSDSRWHECGHGTAFKTRWMNDVVYHIACFMICVSRRSGAGAIPAITRTRSSSGAIPKSGAAAARYRRHSAQSFALKSGLKAFRKLALHARGRLTEEEKTFVPDMERWKVYLAIARIYLGIFAGCAIADCVLHSVRSCRRC